MRTDTSEHLSGAIANLSVGEPVVIFDETRQRSELIFGARTASVDLVAFAVRVGSGLIEAALPRRRCNELGLVSMPGTAPDHPSRIAVDAAVGIGTGISATDRARTLRVLGDPSTKLDDLRRPGHVLTIAIDDDACRCRLSQSFLQSLALLMADAEQPPAFAITTLIDRESGEALDQAAAGLFALRAGMPFLSAAMLSDEEHSAAVYSATA